MTIPASVDWDVKTTGDDTNGGGFDIASVGTDRSLSASPHVTIDGGSVTATVHSTTDRLNITGHTVATADKGNIVNIISGTATAGRYCILDVDTGNNRWIIDRAAGTSGQTVSSGRMGGCLATPGKLGKILSTSLQGVSGQLGYIQAGTYTLTTSTADSGGPFLNSNVMAWIHGYTTTHGDATSGGRLQWMSSKPIINAGTITNVVLWKQGYGNFGGFINLEADGNSKTGVSGFEGGYAQHEGWGNCAKNCNQSNCWGFKAIANTASYAYNCNWGVYTGSAFGCRAKSCGYGFYQPIAVRCLADRCTTYGFYCLSSNYTYHCAADRNAIGFYVPGNTNLFECVASRSTTYNFANQSTTGVVHCAGYNTGTANYQTTPTGTTRYSVVRDFITLSADPFVDSANEDYRLNSTAGGGALLRAAGYGLWQQTDSIDINAAQVVASTSNYNPFRAPHVFGAA